jgi:hypothetical protein
MNFILTFINGFSGEKGFRGNSRYRPAKAYIYYFSLTLRSKDEVLVRGK